MQSITPWRKETAGKGVIWRGFHWELNVPDHNDTLVGQNQSRGFSRPSGIQEARLPVSLEVGRARIFDG